jgi:mannosyltransferase
VSVTRSHLSRATETSPGPASADQGASDPPDGAGKSVAGAQATFENDQDRVGIELKVVVAVAIAIGVALRFIAPSPLWLDEALSVNIAQLPIGDIPEALRHDGHPPLYYVLLHLWMQLAGTGDDAVRALSGIISTASLPFAYLVGRRAGGRSLGWITLGLFALCPFVLRYATETRMYSLIILLVLVGYLLLDDITRRGRAGWARVIAFGAVVGALLYSHYWAMWLLGGVGMVLVWCWRRATDEMIVRGSGRALIGMAVGGAAFLPWTPVLLYQSKHTGTPWAGPVRPTSMVASTLTDFGGGAFKDAQLVGGILLVLVLLAVFGRALSGRRIELDLRSTPQFRAEAAVVAATIVLALGVSYATRSAFVTRYASTFLPLVLLLAAGGLTRLLDRRARAAGLAVVLGLFGLGCVYNLTTDRTQAKVIAAEVARAHRPQDLVVYCPDQLGPAGLRLMPTDVRQVAFPTLDRPDRIEWVDYTVRNQADPVAYARQLLDTAGDAHGIFVVWSGGYKTHQGTCEAIIAELGAHRSPAHTLVSEDGDEYFEHANLTYFEPAAPAAGP